MGHENVRIKVLIKKLRLSSTAEFCRKSGLGRSLVDKLATGENKPRFETLIKIKQAFPQINMNWLVSGQGEVFDTVLDEDETVIVELYRKNIKPKKDLGLLMTFVSAIEWLDQEYLEMIEMENNEKAQLMEDSVRTDFRVQLILYHEQRRRISSVLRCIPEHDENLKVNKLKRAKFNELLKKNKISINNTVNLLEEG